MFSDRELALGWWEYHRLSVGSREERRLLEVGGCPAAQAGYSGVGERMQAGGRSALDLVVALIEAAPADGDLGMVGAGPLEDLLHEHANSLVGDIESLARTHPGFRAALSSAYVPEDHPSADVRRRLARRTPR